VGNSARGNAKHRRLIPIQNTEFLKPDNLTIASVLKAAGYKTIHLGKWHISMDPLEQGFDVNIGGGKQGGPSGGGYFSPFENVPMAKFNDQYPKGTHRVDIFADQAIQFMRENCEESFFMHMAFYSVHTKLEAVPEYIEKYRGRAVNAVYASMIEKMDEGIGRILDELDDLGLKENTVVFFCSDNGGICEVSSQKPFRAGKGSYFEGGTREPLVVRWPDRVLPDSTCRVPVSGIDFYPTFLDIAGVDVPEGKILDGVSLMPLLTGSGPIEDRALFWHFPVYLQKYGGVKDESHDPLFRTRPGSTLRQGKWKFHEYFEDGRIELYDLETDPGERANLASRYPEKASELHGLLKQWRGRIKAPVPTERNLAFDPDAEAAALTRERTRPR
jgi:arylsulfatase A-like enzyme